MTKDQEDELIEDLIEIIQKKRSIAETKAFTIEAHEKFLEQQRKRRIRLWSISISSAAAILLLALFVMPSFLSLDGPAMSHNLYHKFDPGLVTRGSANIDPIVNVITRYTENNFNQAIVQADSILCQQPNNGKLFFFKGLSEMELHQPDQAVPSFNRAISEGGPIEAYSRWYLALAYLQQENFTACKEQLASLKKLSDHPYKDQVKMLYRRLRFRKNP